MLFLESLILCFNLSGNCVAKRGCPFSFVTKELHQEQSLLRSLKVLAVHVLQITKTCRFATRRACPARHKGGYLGEMCAPSSSCCNKTFRNNNILSSFYVHLTSKRSLPEIAGQFRALAACCNRTHNCASEPRGRV